MAKTVIFLSYVREAFDPCTNHFTYIQIILFVGNSPLCTLRAGLHRMFLISEVLQNLNGGGEEREKECNFLTAPPANSKP